MLYGTYEIPDLKFTPAGEAEDGGQKMTDEKDRPRHPYGVRFTAHEIAAVDTAAEQAGMSRHAFVRLAALVLAGYSRIPDQLRRLTGERAREG